MTILVSSLGFTNISADIMHKRKKMKKAQSVLEYALVIGIVVAALMAMNVYVQRSVQSNLKSIEDRITASPVAHGPETPPPPPPPPVEGTSLPNNKRMEFCMQPGEEFTYVANVESTDSTTLMLNLIGTTNETDATFTWTFPDGKEFSGSSLNTSINGLLYLRTQKAQQDPNLVGYDYIPAGQHVLKIKANNSSCFVMRAGWY